MEMCIAPLCFFLQCRAVLEVKPFREWIMLTFTTWILFLTSLFAAGKRKGYWDMHGTVMVVWPVQCHSSWSVIPIKILCSSNAVWNSTLVSGSFWKLSFGLSLWVPVQRGYTWEQALHHQEKPRSSIWNLRVFQSRNAPQSCRSGQTAIRMLKSAGNLALLDLLVSIDAFGKVIFCSSISF